MKSAGSRGLESVREWRANDQHTGIGRTDGVPYTYAHATSAPRPSSQVYRVETFIDFEHPTAIHRNVHYVPATQLDSFFEGWGAHGEQVVDIRPVTTEQALAELRSFREAAETGGSA